MPRAPDALKQLARAPARPAVISPSVHLPRRSSSLHQRIPAFLATLPADPRQRLAAVADLYRILRKQIAAALEPATSCRRDGGRGSTARQGVLCRRAGGYA